MAKATTVHENARKTHIFAEADVVVVGGGPAGVTAAIAAAARAPFLFGPMAKSILARHGKK